MAAEFLNQPDIITVEDWGCGYGGFKGHIAEHQTYIGVDGAQTKAACKILNLEKFSMSPEQFASHEATACLEREVGES